MKDEHTPQLCGWGMLPGPGRELQSEDLVHLTLDVPLSRGLGRSYGDSSLPPADRPVVAGTVLADRILAFNEQTGVIRTEAGFSLDALIKVFLKRGFFTPVTPGTRYVTVGGMVASDVHGKNHHVDGCFGEHVKSLRLRLASGRILDCSPSVEPELFRATLGGMGLTGHILEVEFGLHRISSPWIAYESERVLNIDAYLEALDTAAKAWPMTVGWIDCIRRGPQMGRGILIKGRWALAEEAPAILPPERRKWVFPFLLPNWVLRSSAVLRLANWGYYWKHWQRKKSGIMHPDSFFYPLDGVLHWNRIYGRKGFTQYQCVLPREAGRGAAREFLGLLTRLGGASFLCVIKDCGAQGTGMLSFPLPGVSIAVDMAVKEDTPKIIDALNEFVLEHGGRIYLTKDQFTRPEHYRQMDPRLEAFLAVKRKWDPNDRIQSAQSIRMFGGVGREGDYRRRDKGDGQGVGAAVGGTR